MAFICTLFGAAHAGLRKNRQDCRAHPAKLPECAVQGKPLAATGMLCDVWRAS